MDLAKNLNEIGIKTKAGDKWSREKIGKILRNSKYMGEYESFETKCEGAIPAIVDKETYEAAQQLLSKNKKAGGKHRARYKYLLSGKIKCGECGSAMCGNYAGISRKYS